NDDYKQRTTSLSGAFAVQRPEKLEVVEIRGRARRSDPLQTGASGMRSLTLTLAAFALAFTCASAHADPVVLADVMKSMSGSWKVVLKNVADPNQNPTVLAESEKLRGLVLQAAGLSLSDKILGQMFPKPEDRRT